MTDSMLTRCATLAVLVASLCGCSSISSTLGLERHVPDETQVVIRPALTLPPDYDLMPPGTPSPVSTDHENGLSLGGDETGAPKKQETKKEERGFFGSIFNFLNPFASDDDTTPAKS